MAKAKTKKPAEKLTPIPKHKPRGRAGAARQGAKAAAAQPAAPDLSYIVEGLRPLAVAVGELQFDPANARTHGEDNLAAIRASLRAYGQRKPVVVNRRTGLVEAGNGTLQAALSLGWTHVAALYVDDDPTAAAGFSIADNRTAELADWSKEALDKLLREAQTDDEHLAAMFDELAKDMKLVPGAGEGCGKDEGPAEYGVVVVCPTKEKQREVFEQLQAGGYNCRLS